MFITIEGIDGCGKSTQAKRLGIWLKAKTGRKTICTFEPGGYPDGKRLRKFILSGEGFAPLAELLLFLADRAEHVNSIILPELKDGHNVICERYNDSTLAYQCGGHGLNAEHVMSIISSCKFPEPDIKIMLEINPELAYSRVLQRHNLNDKFESEGLSLMKRVSDFYRTLEGYIVIRCTDMNESEVFMNITSELEKRL